MILSINIDWSIIKNKDHVWLWIALLSILDLGGLYLVAYAWSILVKFIEPRDVKNSELIYIYIKSNIAKYLPGNVMNLVGRNVLADRLGFKHMNIATSSIIEVISFACTTVILTIIFSINKLQEVYIFTRQYINYNFIKIIILVSTLIFVVIIIYIVNTKKNIIKNIRKYFNISFLKLSSKLMFLYSVYFVVLGIILVVILTEILNVSISLNNLAQIIGFYTVSYFIGYITPGSPGGVGVRETALILLLTTITGSELSTIAAIMHRVITVIADMVIYFICCSKIRGKFKK